MHESSNDRRGLRRLFLLLALFLAAPAMAQSVGISYDDNTTSLTVTNSKLIGLEQPIVGPTKNAPNGGHVFSHDLIVCENTDPTLGGIRYSARMPWGVCHGGTRIGTSCRGDDECPGAVRGECNALLCTSGDVSKLGQLCSSAADCGTNGVCSENPSRQYPGSTTPMYNQADHLTIYNCPFGLQFWNAMGTVSSSLTNSIIANSGNTTSSIAACTAGGCTGLDLYDLDFNIYGKESFGWRSGSDNISCSTLSCWRNYWQTTKHRPSFESHSKVAACTFTAATLCPGGSCTAGVCGGGADDGLACFDSANADYTLAGTCSTDATYKTADGQWRGAYEDGETTTNSCVGYNWPACSAPPVILPKFQTSGVSCIGCGRRNP